MDKEETMSDTRVSRVQPAIFRYRSLVLLGLCCELVYLGYFVTQFSLLPYYHHDTDMEGNPPLFQDKPDTDQPIPPGSPRSCARRYAR